MGLAFSKRQDDGGGESINPGAVAIPEENFIVDYIAKSLHIRGLVSKKRRRMVIGGYDLDMTYISDRILAMSFPSQRMRAVFRNPLWQVKSVLDMRHPARYKVYNLCVEESYDPSNFHCRVEQFPIDDNHVPSLQMIKLFCESVNQWLSQDPKNIVVIHCMAGKGRTGLMVCCYLVYSGMTAGEALQLYAKRRFINNEGVTIPSQRRYIHYWETVLSSPRTIARSPLVAVPQRQSRELRRIRLYDAVNTDSVFFVVQILPEVVEEGRYGAPVEVGRSFCRRIKKGYQRNNSPRYYLSFVDYDGDDKAEEGGTPRLVVQMDTESPVLYQTTCLDFYFDQPLQVAGDVRVIFYQKMNGGRLFYTCFNTAFIKNSLLQLRAGDLDKVGSKGRSVFGPDFCVEVLFGPVNGRSPSSGNTNNSSSFISESEKQQPPHSSSPPPHSTFLPLHF